MLKLKGDEKTLTIEMLASLTCDVAASLTKGRPPKPSSLIATLLTFGILSAVGNAWPTSMPLCTSIGGLVVLTEFVSSNGPGRAINNILGNSKWAHPTPTTADVQAYQFSVLSDNALHVATSGALSALPTRAQTGSAYYTLPGTPSQPVYSQPTPPSQSQPLVPTTSGR